MTHSISVIHGPNLNLLGTREPGVYGTVTLDQINTALVTYGKQLGASVSTFQSNSEGALVDAIQQAGADGCEFIIINPAAYTHTSVAIRDALSGVKIPFIEVHLSNIHQRESFRHHSFVSAIAMGTIVGLGASGYRLAMARAIEYLTGETWPASLTDA